MILDESSRVFRQPYRAMRWNLLKTYDKIDAIDLHGNSKKKETALDSFIDQNAFDIL